MEWRLAFAGGCGEGERRVTAMGMGFLGGRQWKRPEMAAYVP